MICTIKLKPFKGWQYDWYCSFVSDQYKAENLSFLDKNGDNINKQFIKNGYNFISQLYPKTKNVSN